MQFVRAVPSPIHPCPVCNSSFPTVAALEHHVNECLDASQTQHDGDYALALQTAQHDERSSNLPTQQASNRPQIHFPHAKQISTTSHTIRILLRQAAALRQTRDRLVLSYSSPQAPSDLYTDALRAYLGVSDSNDTVPRAAPVAGAESLSGTSTGAGGPTVTHLEASLIDKAVRSLSLLASLCLGCSLLRVSFFSVSGCVH